MSKATKNAVSKPREKTTAKNGNVTQNRAGLKFDHPAMAVKLLDLHSEDAAAAKISVRFIGGNGRLTISLHRHGEQIAMGVTTGDDINFPSVEEGDVISVNGVGTGSTKVSISIATDPETPMTFTEHIVMNNFYVN